MIRVRRPGQRYRTLRQFFLAMVPVAVISTGFFCCAMGAAQTVSQFAFAVPYQIMDDHPDCKGPDKIAFSAAMNDKKVPIRIELLGEKRGLEFPGGHEADEFLGECHKTVRRGVNTTTVIVPCNDDDVRDPKNANAWFALNPPDARLSLKTSYCLAPEGIEMLNGQWSLNFVAGDTDLTYSGNIDAVDQNFELALMSGARQALFIRQPELHSPSNVVFSARCLEASIEGLPEPEVHLAAKALFFLRKPENNPEGLTEEERRAAIRFKLDWWSPCRSSVPADVKTTD